MIEYENEYEKFIMLHGVGSNDIVASSPKSYIRYLQSVSTLLNQNISPKLIQNEESLDEIIHRIEGLRAKKTLLNYKTALNQYLKFCQQR